MAIVDKKNTKGRNPAYLEHLERIAEQGLCPFCPDRLHLEHPNPIIVSNDTWLATESAYPYAGAANHVLLIARQHIETLETVTPYVWSGLGEIIDRVTDMRAMKGAAFLMRLNDTSYTGASVVHLHGHLIQGQERKEGSEPIMAVVGFRDPELE